MNIKNAGEFWHKIEIKRGSYVKDAEGVKTWQPIETVLSPYAKVQDQQKIAVGQMAAS